MSLGWAPPILPKQFDDIEKFSNCTNTAVVGLRGEAGREDFIDAVRGRNISIHNVIIEPSGSKGAICIKGSYDGYVIDDVVYEGHGSEYDIEIGQFDNYWRPGRAPTRNGIIRHVVANDGKPVVVKLYDAEEPMFGDGCHVEVIRIPKWKWFPYFLFRYVTIRIQNLFGAEIVTK